MSEKTPIVGKIYEARGFTFRVDDVKNGEVYVVRWRYGQKIGQPMRVSIAAWNRDMRITKSVPS